MAACLTSGDHDDYQNNVSGASKEWDEIDNTFSHPLFRSLFFPQKFQRNVTFEGDDTGGTFSQSRHVSFARPHLFSSNNRTYLRLLWGQDEAIWNDLELSGSFGLPCHLEINDFLDFLKPHMCHFGSSINFVACKRFAKKGINFRQNIANQYWNIKVTYWRTWCVESGISRQGPRLTLGSHFQKQVG